MIKSAPSSREQAFSLVELSIVLVILGLLVGGVLSGQSLIRAAELRSTVVEFQRYSVAAQTFRDKYFALPGDFNASSRFWNRLNNNADCVTNSAAAVSTPGACDGNGHGDLDIAAAASQSGERHQFWRHLALAGLIEGSYTGIAGSGGQDHAIIVTNAPASKLSNAGWSAREVMNNGWDANRFATDIGNALIFGSATASTVTNNYVLRPEEAWNIDTKMDDGKPAIGIITARNFSGCGTATLATDLAAPYRLDSSSVACALYIKL